HRFVRPDDHGDIRLRHGHDSPSSLPPQRWNISPVSPHSLLGRWQFARTGCLTPLFPCFTSQGPVPLNGHGKGLGPRGSTPRGPSPVERAGGQPAAMPSASPFAVARWTGTASTISTSGPPAVIRDSWPRLRVSAFSASCATAVLNCVMDGGSSGPSR